MKAPRRIVTGHNAAGQSVVAIDTVMKPTIERPEIGVAFYEVWNTAGSGQTLLCRSNRPKKAASSALSISDRSKPPGHP